MLNSHLKQIESILYYGILGYAGTKAEWRLIVIEQVMNPDLDKDQKSLQ